MRSKNLTLISTTIMTVFLIVFIITLASAASAISLIPKTPSYYYPQSTIDKLMAPHVISIVFSVLGLIASLVGVWAFFSSNEKCKTVLSTTLLLYSLEEVIVLFVTTGGRLASTDLAIAIFLFMMVIASLVSLVSSFDDIEYKRSATALLVTNLLWLIIITTKVIGPTSVRTNAIIFEIVVSIMTVAIMLIEAFGRSTRSHSELQQPTINKESTVVGRPNENTFAAPIGPRPASTQPKEQSSQQDSVTEKLALIKDLRDKWLITEEEYNQKREEIIKSI